MRVVQYSQCPPRSGAAAVELAVSLPLLLLLLLGCIDVGRFALRYICLSNAASEAATFASLNAPGQFGGGGWLDCCHPATRYHRIHTSQSSTDHHRNHSRHVRSCQWTG